MRRIPVRQPRMPWDKAVKERWFCPWCYAWTEFGYDPREVSRPQYGYIPWERAESPQLSEDIAHAFDVAYAYSVSGFGATLCGLTHEGLTASPYLWISDGVRACQACNEAAAVIDARWPLEMRNGNRVSPAPPPGTDWPPF
ncbi:hypothetical protein [Streptomyces scabiei]|uniref:hypothetical protein n=1 Tax=Streptomyces TaxID=1883 RepID=UPI0029C0F199|nr:hypothetical protein [Streptomyces scabiei]